MCRSDPAAPTPHISTTVYITSCHRHCFNIFIGPTRLNKTRPRTFSRFVTDIKTQKTTLEILALSLYEKSMYLIGEVKQRRVRSTFGWVAAGNPSSTGHYLYIFVIIQKLLTKNMIRTLPDMRLVSGPRKQMLERPHELGS
jgi:hypothetical protein